jgi:hypothetical protein
MLMTMTSSPERLNYLLQKKVVQADPEAKCTTIQERETFTYCKFNISLIENSWACSDKAHLNKC